MSYGVVDIVATAPCSTSLAERRSKISPIVPTTSLMVSVTDLSEPAGGGNRFGRAISQRDLGYVRDDFLESALRATKSVSEFTSTMGASRELIDAE